MPLKFTKLAEHVHACVRERIVRGELGAGARLPTEREFCAMFEVSRPVVREALGRLRAEGLVVSRRGSGSYVRAHQPEVGQGLPELRGERDATLVQLLRYFEFRLSVEPDAAFFAASRRSDEQLAAMEAAIDDLAAALAARRLEHDAHFRFHLAVASAAANPLYVGAVHGMRQHMDVSMNLVADLWLLNPSEKLTVREYEHADIVDAIACRDAPRAARTMRAHIIEGREEVFGDLAELPATAQALPD